MRCSHCSYESSDNTPYCPSCGKRVNASCEIAVVDGSRVCVRIMVPRCDYPQTISMAVDGLEALAPIEFDEDQSGGLQTLGFDFPGPVTAGYHNTLVYDKLHPFQKILDETPVNYVNLTQPTIDLDKYVFINDGKLRLQLCNMPPELESILTLHYSVNRRQPKPAGLAQAGGFEIIISDWRDLGVVFDNTDQFETSLELFYQLWDSPEIKPFYSNHVFFVNRFRLVELSYLCPGLAPQTAALKDKYASEVYTDNLQPINLATYLNPFLNRNWQKDKRYFKISEGFHDLLDVAGDAGRKPEIFAVDLDYDKSALDLRVCRIEKFDTGDIILQIDTAKTLGLHRVDMILSIGDVHYPQGRFVARIPIHISVVDEWTNVLGLGLDFGTSRTMASIFNGDDNLHEVVGLDLKNYGTSLEQKMALSVIPRDRNDYHDQDLGLIYPYICSDIKPDPSNWQNDYGLKLYVKRDISRIMRNNKEITDQIRETVESMFEALVGRIMEYVLQTKMKIPSVGDICLGCPTVFDDSTIMQYRDFLKNVCLASLMQPSPDFNVTVWDEVWAAFYYINSEYGLEPGYYVIWDTGGGTTDVVMVHLDEKGAGSMPIIGYNSDFLGGKDVNEELRRILTEYKAKDLDNIAESVIESLKTSMSNAPKGKFRDVPHKDLSSALQVFMGEKIRQIAAGLVDSVRRLGNTPSRLTILPIGGGAHMKFIGPAEDLVSLGEIIQEELGKLMPNTEIVVHSMHNSHQDREINRKACTSLGLSALSGNPNYKGRINRLPGLTGKCRYTIIRRDVLGRSETVLNIGDPLNPAALIWLESTNMFLVFGGSNTDENINIPIIYGNPAAWEGFLSHLFTSDDEGVK